MWGSASLLTASPRSLFLMCVPPCSPLPDGLRGRLFFFLRSSLLRGSLHSGGTSIAIIPSRTQEVLPTPTGRGCLTGLSPLTSSSLVTLARPPFFIAPLAVASFLASPLLPLLLPFPALGGCFRTWVLTAWSLSLLYGSFLRPLLSCA